MLQNKNNHLSVMRNYWFNKKCCVPDCTNCSTMGSGCSKEYFDLPAEPQARARWLKAVLTKDGDNLKVCEDHFNEQDIFLDKSNKKKLKINSTPNKMLPQQHGIFLDESNEKKLKINPCIMLPQRKFNGSILNEKQSFQGNGEKLNDRKPRVTEHLIPEKRSRRSRSVWTKEQRAIIFLLIKKYGEVKVLHNNIRINWTNVFRESRKFSYFTTEKELKTIWQYLRVRAVRVSNNECIGTKLDQRIAKYLTYMKEGNHTYEFIDTSDDEFEDIPNDVRLKLDNKSDYTKEQFNCTEMENVLKTDIQHNGAIKDSVTNNNTEQDITKTEKNVQNNIRKDETIMKTIKEVGTIGDDISEINNSRKDQRSDKEINENYVEKIDDINNSNCTNAVTENEIKNQLQSNIENLTVDDKTNHIKPKDGELEMKNDIMDSGQDSDSGDEYYSLADIERKYGIKINTEIEAISLLSSDESDWD